MLDLLLIPYWLEIKDLVFFFIAETPYDLDMSSFIIFFSYVTFCRIYVLNFCLCYSDPCEDKQCFFNSTCTKGLDNQARCICPQCAGQAVNYICASDGNSYANLCQARRHACLRKINLQVIHGGKCSKYLMLVTELGFFS
jgi:hypothetical protein